MKIIGTHLFAGADLHALQRPEPSLIEEFNRWKLAQAAVERAVGGDEDMVAEATAYSVLMDAPCGTPGDFMLKAYVNLLGHRGSTLHGEAKSDGTGNLWDIELGDIERPADQDGEYILAAYRDLDASDLGACLLAFGEICFCEIAWIDRVLAVGMVPWIVSDALHLGEPFDQPPARIRRERDRLKRLFTFDPSRQRIVCSEIKRNWPQLITKAITA